MIRPFMIDVKNEIRHLLASVRRYPLTCFGILIPIEIALSFYGIARFAGHFAIDFSRPDGIGLALVASLFAAAVLYFPLVHAIALLRNRKWAYYVCILYGPASAIGLFLMDSRSSWASSPLFVLLPVFGFYTMVRACRKIAEVTPPPIQI